MDKRVIAYLNARLGYIPISVPKRVHNNSSQAIGDEIRGFKTLMDYYTPNHNGASFIYVGALVANELFSDKEFPLEKDIAFGVGQIIRSEAYGSDFIFSDDLKLLTEVKKIGFCPHPLSGRPVENILVGQFPRCDANYVAMSEGLVKALMYLCNIRRGAQ